MARRHAGHLSTGVDAIDDEHWGLLAVLGELTAAVGVAGRPSPTVALLDRLREMTADHFASEEREMAASRYPMASSHIAQHRRFLDELAQVSESVADGSAAVTQNVVRHLEVWFSRHIEVADRPLAEWLLAHPDRLPQPPAPRPSRDR